MFKGVRIGSSRKLASKAGIGTCSTAASSSMSASGPPPGHATAT